MKKLRITPLGMQRSSLAAIVFALSVTLGGSTDLRAQCFESTLMTVTRTDTVIRRYSLPDLTPLVGISVPDPFPGFEIEGFSAIAADPSDPNRIALLVRQVAAPVDIPFLCFYDIDNGSTELIGPAVVDFVCLTFNAGNQVLSVSSDSASPADAYCELSQFTGGPIDICELGNGDTGVAIAYRTVDDSVYHASGDSNVIFERVSNDAISPCGTSSIAIGAPLTDGLVSAICYYLNDDVFIWKQGGVGGPLFLVTPDGAATSFGTLDHDATGMTVLNVPGPCPVDLFLRGDINGDGGVDVSDAVFGLAALFIPGSTPVGCADSGDVNDDSSSDVSDMVYLLSSLFVPGSPPPPAPSGTCGDDPTPDSLDCATYDPC